jgi:cytochrome c551/c552
MQYHIAMVGRTILVTMLLFLGRASAFEGDAYRGAALLEQSKCTQCHSIRGRGGKTAPDLGARTSRQFTPALLASVMWNHAPKMWSAMASEGIERPNFTERDAGDLFVYFYSVRFFEKPGEAERGKRLFVENHCAECHALSEASTGPGKPVREWTAMSDPIALVQAMWNHSPFMKEAFAAKRFKWITLSAQDLTDLSVYLQNLPHAKPKPANFWLQGPQTGEALFREKTCAGCHQGARSPEHLLSNQTLTGVAAEMWNHAPRMVNAPLLTIDEMRQILAYIWERQYLGTNGNAEHGSRVFEKKNCVVCHNDSPGAAPHLGRRERPYSPVTMISVLWQHGPAMLQEMQKKNVPWPRFTPSELSDLTAYLNVRP